MPSTNASSAEALDFGLATDHQTHLDDVMVDIVTVHETGLVGRPSVAP